MSTSLRFTSADLESLPDIDGARYEIIDGELYVSRTTDWRHQYACGRIVMALQLWSDQTGSGVALFAPDDDVIPDVVWISRERLASLSDEKGHFRGAPELVVEVLSPGAANELRDRELKLNLYSRQGVSEYWIVDWRARVVQVFRAQDMSLELVATVVDDGVLTSPLLPGFVCPISSFWALAT